MKYWHSKSRLFARPGAASLILLLALGVGAPLVGCASAQDENSDLDQLGTLGLNLEVAPGVTLLSVSYSITGNGFTKTGSIDVGNSPTINGTIGGIPAGSGYTLALSATSVEDATSFTGSANFNVTAGQTTSVSIHLTGGSGGGTGSVSLNGSVSLTGTINVGPVIEEFTVTPLTVFVGGEIALEAIASDADNGPSPLSYSWTTSVGVIASPTAPITTITSATPGSGVVTLTVSDGGITSTRTTTVTFVP